MDTPIHRLLLMKAPPTIDGVMQKGEWDDASALSAFFSDFALADFRFIAPRQTHVVVYGAIDRDAWMVEIKIPFASFAHGNYAGSKPPIASPPADGTIIRRSLVRGIGGNGTFFICFDAHVWNATKTQFMLDSQAPSFQVSADEVGPRGPPSGAGDPRAVARSPIPSGLSATATAAWSLNTFPLPTEADPCPTIRP